MAEKTAEKKKNDWALKLLALVFAVILWFYADAEQNPITNKQFDIPVQYINQAEEYVISDGAPTVRVTVRGKGTDLSSLRSDDFTATVDLSGAMPGDNEYDIVIEAPNVAERFSYQPTKTRLVVDRMQTKQVPVRVQTTGTLPTGYELISTDVTPEQVTISGLEKDLSAISFVETEEIDISHMVEETTREVALELPESAAVQGEQRIAVHFVIQEQQAHSNYEATIEQENVAEGLTASLERQTATLLLSGNQNLLTNQSELAQIYVYVDCTGLEAGQYQLPLQVRYTGSLEVAQITPATVTVTMENNSDTAVTAPEEPTDGDITEPDTNTEGELN